MPVPQGQELRYVAQQRSYMCPLHGQAPTLNLGWGKGTLDGTMREWSAKESPNVARFQLQDAPGASAGLSSAAIRPFGPLP